MFLRFGSSHEAFYPDGCHAELAGGIVGGVRQRDLAIFQIARNVDTVDGLATNASCKNDHLQ